MIARRTLLTVAVLAMAAVVRSTAAASDNRIEVENLDAIVKNNPLPAGGHTAAFAASIRAGGAELGVLVMSKNPLHHHSHQDHVLYVARGNGTAKLENASGQIETRAIKPGDILSLPRGRKHGFEKAGGEELVFLVVATPLPPGVDETTYHE